MIIDWRSKRYRGGSRWLAAGILAVSVGVTTAAAEAADGEIIYVEAYDRTILVDAYDRTILIEAYDRTIEPEEKPTP